MLLQGAKTRIKRSILMLLFILSSIIVYLYIIIPKFDMSIPCVWRSMTGLYCPGCGMTRFAYAILNLDIYQSLRYNIMPFVIIPLFAIHWNLDSKGYEKQAKALMYTVLIIVILYGILRNTAEFKWLAPTRISYN